MLYNKKTCPNCGCYYYDSYCNWCSYREDEESKQERKDGLTEEEGYIMDILTEANNKFLELKMTHPDARNLFIEGLSKCQTLLMHRVLQRDYPEGYPTYDVKNKK